MNNTTVKQLLLEYEENFYMYIPLTIILQSCIGSIAAMLILETGTTVVNFFALFMCVIICMAYNGALMAGIKKVFSFWILMASLIINCLLILLYLL
jgi:hypothetical protein